jgi:hypothetical protein
VDWSIIAIVQIDFNARILSDADVQAVEGLLRKDNDVDNLNVHPRSLSFYIWGKEKVGYGVLDGLRDRLRELGYDDFEISAREYAASGKGYHYRSQM